MDDEEKAPRSPILTELEQEDLEKLSKDELEHRITRLTGEIERARNILKSKQKLAGTADALFRRT